MPTGERTAASRGHGRDNPFARGTKTHFARFVVLDDVVFNGRVSGDSLLDLIRGVDPSVAQPIDRLSTPFLIFLADFDAESGGDDQLGAYLTELWATMSSELIQIFQHCVGFASVGTAEDFVGYIKKCQVETTMPFNDYWSVPPALGDFSLVPYGIGAVLAVALFLGGLVAGQAWLLGAGVLVLALPSCSSPTAGSRIRRSGHSRNRRRRRPSSDLPTILKALYLQRVFTDLAISVQGQDDQALHDAFSRFIAHARPHDIAAPTQRPGVIGV